MGCAGSRARAVHPLVEAERRDPEGGVNVRFHVDYNGMVVISDEASNLAKSVGVEIESGQSVFSLITPALSSYHRLHIFPTVSLHYECERYHDILGTHRCRRSNFSLDSSPSGMSARIAICQTPAGFDLQVYDFQKSCVRPAFIDHEQLASRLQVSEGYGRSVELAILVVDVVRSTELMLRSGPFALMSLLSRLQCEARRLICSTYSPLVSLYETAGDALIFVSYHECAIFEASPCVLLADFAADIRRNTMDFVDLRFAASYGTCIATVIDCHVRLFGPPVSLACRLQAHVSPLQGTGKFDVLSVCEAFYARLRKELIFNPISRWNSALPSRRQAASLKGFGESVFFYALTFEAPISTSDAKSKSSPIAASGRTQSDSER